MKNELVKVAEKCRAFGLKLDQVALERLETYAARMLKWNEKVNLTAITESSEVANKHFLDSLLFFDGFSYKAYNKIVDVGTGAGFPGMVIKIARPDFDVTLLDGTNKRLIFLSELASELGLTPNIVHMRAEDAGRNPDFREKYDVATARAVAKMSVLSEYCLPFVRKGGSFIAMKGPTAKEELSEARKAILTMGGGEVQVKSHFLPDGSERCIVYVKKASQTPTIYPRNFGQIQKKPL